MPVRTAGAVLVVGECLADIKPSDGAAVGDVSRTRDLVAFPGGGPANIAVGLARLGAPVAFAGRFARAGLGPWLWQHVAASGADMSLSVRSDDPATIALVTVEDGGGATYSFYGPGTSDWQWSPEELPDAGVLSGGERTIVAVHTGSLATALDPGATAITAWLRQLRDETTVAVSYDPNVRPGLMSMDRMVPRVEQLVGLADLVKVSSDDMDVLYPGQPHNEIALRWLDEGAGAVVVTMGEQGAAGWSRCGGRQVCPAPSVEVSDTIGAGDSFMSALLADLLDKDRLTREALADLSDQDLGAALRVATHASAITCTRAGADPPTAADLDAFDR